MQFHPGGSGPLIAMGAGRRDVDAAQTYWFQGSGTSNFTDGGLIALGKWTDFVFQIDWNTGAVTIYRRDQGHTKFVQVLNIMDAAMLPPDSGYFKQGLYRGPNVNGRTDVLWMGPAARGTSFAAVEQAAFGTNDAF